MPSSLAAAYAAAVMILMVAPVLLVRSVAGHIGVPAREALRGSIGFVMVQVLMGFAALALQPALGGAVGTLARALMVGAASALIEESTRLWSIRRWVRPPPGGSRGLVFALGWGGCEAALAGGSVLVTLAQLLYGDPEQALSRALSGPELESARQYLTAQRLALLGAPLWHPAVMVAEQGGVLCLQLFLTALVVRAVRGGGARLWAAALGTHAATVTGLSLVGGPGPGVSVGGALSALALGLALLPAALALFRGTPPEVAATTRPAGHPPS